MQLPEKYKEEMHKILGDDYSGYLSSFDMPRVYGLRVNTLKISVEDFLKISPFDLTPIPWTANGFYYDGEKVSPAKHPYYYAGLYYLQEPSAMIAAQILPIEEDDVVLDGCAAPGGKSTEIASKLKKKGLLVSNDISASRCQGLLKNIELFGVGNCFVTSQDLSVMADKFENKFDKILLDVPCSGEGMFRKDPSLIKSWLERGNDYYSDIQKQIVLSAAKMLKQGGKMVYSTCTFSPKEDEEVIECLMQHNPEFHVLPIENRYDKFEYGLTESLKQAIRIYPFKVQGEGHFAVLLQKGETVEKQSHFDSSASGNVDESVQQFLEKVNKNWQNGRFEEKNEKVYFIPESVIDWKSVRIIRSGLLLGTLKKGRFEPSNAFALALKKEQFQNVLDFSSMDQRVIRYLKGETLDVSDLDNYTNDWVLVCVDGYPLGWAKINNGSLKNKYEAGYRWL